MVDHSLKKLSRLQSKVHIALLVLVVIITVVVGLLTAVELGRNRAVAKADALVASLKASAGFDDADLVEDVLATRDLKFERTDVTPTLREYYVFSQIEYWSIWDTKRLQLKLEYRAKRLDRVDVRWSWKKRRLPIDEF